MRRLAVFAFITVAFCPPIGMLLMLAYAALTGGLGQLSLGTDWMLTGLWGGASLLLAALAAAAALSSAKRQDRGSP
jgi:membrane protein implicated in regulation of membrane protease activity